MRRVPDTERDRATETQTDIGTHTDIDTDTDISMTTHIDADTDMDTDTEIDADTHTGTGTDTATDTVRMRAKWQSAATTMPVCACAGYPKPSTPNQCERAQDTTFYPALPLSLSFSIHLSLPPSSLSFSLSVCARA